MTKKKRKPFASKQELKDVTLSILDPMVEVQLKERSTRITYADITP